MNTDQVQTRGKHDELTGRIVRVFYDVYNELGYGFLESVYREALRIALVSEGLSVGMEVAVPVHFRGAVIGMFRADLIVNDLVLLELKTCSALIKQHKSQTLHYLRATRIEVALLMNFGPEPKFKRLSMDNVHKGKRTAKTVAADAKHSLESSG